MYSLKAEYMQIMTWKHVYVGGGRAKFRTLDQKIKYLSHTKY